MKSENLIAKDGKDYQGKYVATNSLKDDDVIADGNNHDAVYAKAKEIGASEPLIVFIPNKMFSFYTCQ
jgi:hypothetical protein